MVEKEPPGLDQCSVSNRQLCILRCCMYEYSNPITVNRFTNLFPV
jgi:hypothetical protein